MHDGRRRLAVRTGRWGVLVLAVVTGWFAITSAGGGHAVGAELVGAPALAAVDVHGGRAAPPVTPSARPSAPQRSLKLQRSLAARTRVSRDHVRREGDLGNRWHQVPR